MIAREFLSGSLVLAVGIAFAQGTCTIPIPASVRIAGCGFTNEISNVDGEWSDGLATVRLDASGRVFVSSAVPGLSWVELDWPISWSADTVFLADTWERAYGYLGWRRLDGGEIVSPWYFLAESDGRTDGWGVGTGPNALACWKVRKDGCSLRLDVRAGGVPVSLGGRTLEAARIVVRRGARGESSFAAGRAFCREMCPRPRLPKEPVYGYNDWYCAYGRNTATNFLKDAAYIVACAKGLANRPYVVMDDGWQKHACPDMGRLFGFADSGMGPWTEAGPRFGMGMETFCRKIAALGAKPGLWYRPLRAWPDAPPEMKLAADTRYFDPTVSAVRKQIVEDIARFRTWGFRLVKIDYLTYDICQRWGFEAGECLIEDGAASWRDRSRTTCEVLKDLYDAMREAAGDDMVLIGCNAINHLAAGVFEIQRIGDDTSGREWARTRKMGVNALAMRAIQDRTFFAADADCVGLASRGAVPWGVNRQWLDLVARSGTPLFVSWRRELADDEFRSALTRAFAIASRPRNIGVPLDWKDSLLPSVWRFSDGEEKYSWFDDASGKDGR